MEGRREIEQRLRDKGLRVTVQRVAVLEFLSGTRSHPTADEVGATVNRRVSTASRASVYNVLHSLRDAGLVEELVFEDAVARYDANLHRHHHFLCTRCRRVEDVPWDALPATPRRRLADGRIVESMTVTLRGVCLACQ